MAESHAPDMKETTVAVTAVTKKTDADTAAETAAADIKAVAK